MTVDALRIAAIGVSGVQIGSVSMTHTACAGAMNGLLNVAARQKEWAGLSGADLATPTPVTQ